MSKLWVLLFVFAFAPQGMIVSEGVAKDKKEKKEHTEDNKGGDTEESSEEESE